MLDLRVAVLVRVILFTLMDQVELLLVRMAQIRMATALIINESTLSKI